MMTIDARNMKAVQDALQSLAQEQMPYAMMTAINTTAFKVKSALQAEMRTVFDRPTPWLIKQTFVEKATKGNLVATISAAEPGEGRLNQVAWNIFNIQSKGGDRLAKAGEQRLRKAMILPSGWVTVPAPDAPLDNYGNLSGAWWMMLLSWLNAASWYREGATQNRAEKVGTRKNKLEKAGVELFAVSPGRAINRHLHPGVYAKQRKDGFNAIKPLLLFVPRATYRARLDWLGVTEQTTLKELPAAMQSAVARALETMR